MKKNILDTFIKRTAINADSIDVFYTFSSGYNDIVWNDLYTKDEHYCDANLLADKVPGLSIGYTDTPSDSIAGSGYFTRNDILRIGSGISYEGWSAFIDFGDAACNIDKQIGNVPEVLLSSMSSPDSISGFSVGINNANKMFIEYNNNNKKEIRTLDRELSNFNVASVSYNNTLNQFELSYHNFPNSTDEYISFTPTNYKHSLTWHLGGVHTPSASYTGYSGYIDDFLLFDKPIDRQTRNRFSEAFFVDKIIPPTTTLTSGYRQLPLGVTVNPTGVIGTEITGYTCDPAVTVGQKVGSDILLYNQTNLTGIKTGTTVEFSVSGSGLVPIINAVPEQIVYDQDEVQKHAKSYILFKEPIESNDLYEFYLFKKPKTNLNKKSAFETSRNAATLNQTYIGGENINLYLNGVVQVSGSPYNIRELNILSNGYYDFNDHISYDKIEGETFTSGFAGNSANHYVDKASLTDEDIYLNGQKLVSGLNYSTAGSTITLYPDLPAGEISFMAQAKDITSIVTGNSNEKVKTDSVDELVWLNGIKQQENKDYFRVNECSLFDPRKKIKKHGTNIYNNNGEFFNIS